MTEFYTRAIKLYDAGLYKHSQKELRKHLEADPDDGKAHAVMSFIWKEIGDQDAALVEAYDAVKFAPQSDYSHYALASVQYMCLQFERAAESMALAISLEPNNPGYFSLASDIEYCRDSFHTALSFANEGLLLNGTHIESLNARARALIGLQRLDEADADLNTALSIDPQHHFLHINKGEIAFKRNLPDEAIAHYRAALRLKPDWQSGPHSLLKAASQKDPALRFILILSNLLLQLQQQIAYKSKALHEVFCPISWRHTMNFASTDGSVLKARKDSTVLFLVRAFIYLPLAISILIPAIAICYALDFASTKLMDYALGRLLSSRK